MNNQSRHEGVLADGTRINYVKMGTGPSIVCIHGWCNDWYGWMPLAKYLQNSLTLYLVDLPGFGDSGEVDEYSIEQQAFHLAQFIKLLPEKPISIVGLSMGSFIVSHLITMFPTISDSVVLAGPVLHKGKWSKLLAKALSYSFRIIDLSDMFESIVKKIMERQEVAYMSAKYINMHRFNKLLIDTYGLSGRKKMKQKAFVQMGSSIGAYNLKNRMQNCFAPALLLYGRFDKISSSTTARDEFFSKKLSMHVVDIDEAGHVVTLEQPEHSARAIKVFLHNQKLI